MNNRYCLKKCPYFDSNNNIVLTECYYVSGTSSGPGCAAYTITVSSNGNISGTPGSSDYIGYESTSVIDRVCIPDIAVLNNGFKSVLTNITTTLQTGQFATMVQDVKNVTHTLILELAMAVGSSRIRNCDFPPFYVFVKMFGWSHCVVVHPRIDLCFCWYGCYLSLQCGSGCV